MRNQICEEPGHEHSHLFDSLSARSKWTIEEDKLMLDWLKENETEKHRWCQELAKVLKSKTPKDIGYRGSSLRWSHRRKYLTQT